MYFVFDSDMQVWKDHTNQAKIEGDPPLIQPHWWECLPISSNLPVIKFEVEHNAPSLDNYFTGTIFDLYSEHLVELFTKNGVKFETFPTIVVDSATKEPISKLYKIFHLLEISYGLDLALSDFGNREIRKLVLSEDCLLQKRALFRLGERKSIVLIHQDLKEILETNNVGGCKFIPLEKFQTGMRLYFDELKSNKK
jgi:hypothetical protein